MSDPVPPVYPWTWTDLVELEAPSERLQVLLKASLQAGDLSMAALVTDCCTDPKAALLPLVRSKSSLDGSRLDPAEGFRSRSDPRIAQNRAGVRLRYVDPLLSGFPPPPVPVESVGVGMP
ncbi:hypothetical protein [Planctomycetes bacterium Poly30]|uniref:hypothetical protein n=1 Tax=Saltatorellus ferox TaxID=2528018 RepID=UPI00119DD49B